MMKQAQLRFDAALLALIALGACGRSGGSGSGSAVAMRQGEWETTVQLTNVDVGNLPPELRGELGRMPANRAETTRGCWAMSADVVRIENLRVTVPSPGPRSAQCHFAELLMEGGTLRGRVSCTGLPGGRMAEGTQAMTVSGELDGTYGPDSVQATASGEVRFGAQSGSGRVRITSRRLGDCPPPRPYVPPMIEPDLPAGNMSTPVVVPVPPVPMPPRPRVAPPPELRGGTGNRL